MKYRFCRYIMSSINPETRCDKQLPRHRAQLGLLSQAEEKEAKQSALLQQKLESRTATQL